MSINAQLLAAIKSRKTKSTPFNGGILTADQYVKTLQDCVGSDACYKFASKGNSFEDTLQKASQVLTYNNADMVVEEQFSKVSELKDKDNNSLEIPKNTLMVFRHVLTTPKKDRDGDILRTEGAIPDPNMLLLWQHVHTLPIGKVLGVAHHDEKSLSLISTIVDMNELSHDAAVMIDSKMGRFSHGFKALEFEKLEGEEDNPWGGFDIKSFEIMEASLVSIPSNTDSETEEIMLYMVESGKLTSSMMKEVGASIRERRPIASSAQYTEKIGDHERTITVGNAADFDAIFKKVNSNENKSRDRITETENEGKGSSSNDTSKETNGNKETTKVSKNEDVKSFMGRTGSERGHDHSVFIDDEGHGETSVNDGHSHQIHLWEVGSEGDHVHSLDRGGLSKVDFEEIDASKAMGIFLSKSTPDEKQKMLNILKSFEDIDKMSERTDAYKSLVGSV